MCPSGPQPNAEEKEERAIKRLMSSDVSFFIDDPFFVATALGVVGKQCARKKVE